MDIAVFQNLFKRALTEVIAERGIKFKDSMEKNAFIREKIELFSQDVLRTLDSSKIENETYTYDQVLQATKDNVEKIFAPQE